MTSIAIHFGVYPVSADTSAVVNGHLDPTSEMEAQTRTEAHGVLTGYVSGSWACWGTHDQDTDGDDSLHYVVYTDLPWTHDLARDLYDSLRRTVAGNVLPYAWITTQEDWAETLSIATFAGGHTCLAAVTGPSAMVVHS